MAAAALKPVMIREEVLVLCTTDAPARSSTFTRKKTWLSDGRQGEIALSPAGSSR